MSHKIHCWKFVVAICALSALSASAASNSSAKVWDVKSRLPLTNSAPFASGQVRQAMFSPDGAFIVTGSGSRAFHIWRVQGVGSARLAGDWTIQIGRNRYGFMRFGQLGSWPRTTFWVWKGTAYRIATPLLFALGAGLLILLAAAVAFLLRRKGDAGKAE